VADSLAARSLSPHHGFAAVATLAALWWKRYHLARLAVGALLLPSRYYLCSRIQGRTDQIGPTAVHGRTGR
jgi:hypothetical protein